MLKLFKALLIVINGMLIIALIFIHFVFKERSYEASLNYYTFPLPVIIIIILIASIFIGKKFRRYNIILAIILLVVWLGRSFKIHIPDKITDNDLEIVFWNASRDNNFEMALKESESFPDVMVLAEGKETNLKQLKDKFPEYHFYKSREDLYLFSKSPINIISEESSQFKTTVIHFETNGINFYAVDVTGSTDVPKSWEFSFLEKWIQPENNMIVLGDFNVPYESKFLNILKTNFQHAFNKKGNGFRETWFWNIPLLSLDHIWVSKDLKILKTQKINTFKSDHSMLKTYIKKP